MDQTEAMVELSKLMSKMGEKGATREEIQNVISFFEATLNTTLACDSIYEFDILRIYRDKYFKEES